MANQLTYILGAGASFQSIPVVKTFNRRLMRFAEYLNRRASEYYDHRRDKYSLASKTFQQLCNDFSSHHSFDTYFKKLFHSGDFDTINQKKRMLNMYFLWEHSSASVGNNNHDDKSSFVKQSLFDKRYDALLAGLLKPISGKAESLCNVNFISWNYDINLLNSIKNFFYPDIDYGEFLEKITDNQFVCKIGEKIRIVNINGYFYNSALDRAKDLSKINFDDILEKMVFSKYFDDHSVDPDADRIRFAWELPEKDINSLSSVLGSVISRADNIVVVGYTFPVYNRFVDFSYLKQEVILGGKIVVQDPNSVEIAENLRDIFRIGKKGKFQVVSNCDSFHLPSSVFGIDEYRPVVKGLN